MKAHIFKEPRTLLLWNFGPQRPGWEKVNQAAQKRGIRVCLVTGRDVGRTVGALCGFPGAGQGGGLLVLDDQAYPPAAIVSGLGNGIDSFVDDLNASGADLPLKAMVTLTSRDWTLAFLLEELMREHQALQGQSE